MISQCTVAYFKLISEFSDILEKGKKILNFLQGVFTISCVGNTSGNMNYENDVYNRYNIVKIS